jgi:hypothetical protein
MSGVIAVKKKRRPKIILGEKKIKVYIEERD